VVRIFLDDGREAAIWPIAHWLSLIFILALCQKKGETLPLKALLSADMSV
jgi:hypothetical protein